MKFLEENLFGEISLIKAVVYALVIVLACFFVNRLIDFSIAQVVSNDKKKIIDKTLVSFLEQILHIGVYITGVGLYAHLVPGLKSFGSALLAGVSVVSIIFAITAQNTLGNFIAGIALLIYRPFQIGDELMVNTPAGPLSGKVESLNLGYTILNTDDNRDIVVPNISMTTAVFVRVTKGGEK